MGFTEASGRQRGRIVRNGARTPAWLAVAVTATLLASCTAHDPQPNVAAQDGGPEERLCVRVVDGDTIELEGGERVRYLGIDSPETVHPQRPVEWMGREATAANRALVEGRRVRLGYDIERLDKYGRTLAYVWIGDSMVNEQLVRVGFAQVRTIPPNVKYQSRLLDAQRAAREAGAGLWGARQTDEGVATVEAPPATVAPETPKPPADDGEVYVTRTGKKYHRAACQYLSKSKIPMRKGDAVAAGYGPCSRCRP